MLNRSRQMQAIIDRCNECADSVYDKAKCEFDGKKEELCPLYPHRAGRRPKGVQPLKSIRKYCLWCCEGSFMEVKLCPALSCPLWAYRFGRLPDGSKYIRGGIASSGAKRKEEI